MAPSQGEGVTLVVKGLMSVYVSVKELSHQKGQLQGKGAIKMN